MEDRSHLQELLETLESGALGLDRGGAGDPAAAVARLFQSAHNLKSGLAMAGLEKASRLFHSLEDGLDDIRRGRRFWSPAWADVVLEVVDRVKVSVEAGQDDELDLALELPAADEGSGPDLSPEEHEALTRAQAAGQHLYRIEKLFLPGLDRSDFEGHLIYDDIADNGTLVSVHPAWDDYSRATGEMVVRFLFLSPRPHQALSQLFFDPLILLFAPQTSEPRSTPGAPGTLEVPADQPRFRVLIVEDNKLAALVMQKTCQKYGSVQVAVDGAEGLTAFRGALDQDEAFDVVILDLEMPGVGGLEVLQSMRADEELRGIWGLDRCLIFMNTGTTDLSKVKVSFQLQADGYFIKPVSIDQIKKRLEESRPWLQTRRRGEP